MPCPPEGPQEDCSCMGAGTEESDEGESGDQQETSFIKVKKETLCYVYIVYIDVFNNL